MTTIVLDDVEIDLERWETELDVLLRHSIDYFPEDRISNVRKFINDTKKELK